MLGCHSCDSEVPTAEFDPPHHRRNGEKMRFCELCAGTLIANAYQYPEQYSYVTPKMLAQALNQVLIKLGGH